MTPTDFEMRRTPLQPLQAVLLGGMQVLFVAALLADYAYSQSYEVQWANFAAWLNAGALVFCGLSLLWALIDLLRASRRGTRGWAFAGLLLATFGTGFIGALLHSRDAWAMMPGGLVASVIAALLALAATWAGFSAVRTGVAA